MASHLPTGPVKSRAGLEPVPTSPLAEGAAGCNNVSVSVM